MQPSVFPNLDPVHTEMGDHIDEPGPGPGPSPSPDPEQPAPGRPTPDGPGHDPLDPLEQPGPDGGGLTVEDRPDGLTEIDAPPNELDATMAAEAG